MAKQGAGQQEDYNQYKIQDTNNNSANLTLNRFIAKLGDIFFKPKTMRNLQHASIAVGFPMDPFKPTSISIHSVSEQIGKN